MQDDRTRAIFGLGNPGLKYAGTRHNAGYIAVERFGTAFGAHFKASSSLNCEQARVDAEGLRIILVKPTTFMNLSGRAVAAVLRWYKLDPAAMLVVHDDVSLPVGRLRYQSGGGAGGQHGVESIIETLGGRRDFDRLKIGVGPDPGGADRAEFVLSAFSGAEKEIFEKAVAAAVESLPLWLKAGAREAMNRYNGLSFCLEEPAEQDGDKTRETPKPSA